VLIWANFCLSFLHIFLPSFRSAHRSSELGEPIWGVFSFSFSFGFSFSTHFCVCVLEYRHKPSTVLERKRSALSISPKNPPYLSLPTLLPPHTHAAVPPPLAHLPMAQGDAKSPTVKETRRGKERGGKLGSLPTYGDMDGSTIKLANRFESVRKQNRGDIRG